MDTKRFNNEFKEIQFIAGGSFGVVFEVMDLKDNLLYAMKKIPLNNVNNKDILRELELMSKLKSDYIVEFKQYWIEKNYYLNDNDNSHIQPKTSVSHKSNIHLLHIQMELCLMTLKKIIEYLNKKEINDEPEELYYYIKCEIFKEILESVDYLHKQRVIHRDLKPENILLTDGNNGRFVKICDFGLAVIHEKTLQSHTEDRGSIRYMAPEVIYGERKYDMRADVFSLGIVMQELFNSKFTKYSDSTTDSLIGNKFKALKGTIKKMLVKKKMRRPTCLLLLNQKKFWALELNEFENTENLKLVLKNNSINIPLNSEAIQLVYRKFIIYNKLFDKLASNYENVLFSEVDNKKSEGYLMEHGPSKLHPYFDFPEVSTVAEASAKFQNQKALSIAIKIYRQNMINDVEMNDGLSDEQIEDVHKKNRGEAIAAFKGINRIKLDEIENQYMKKLVNLIQEAYETYQKMNYVKRVANESGKKSEAEMNQLKQELEKMGKQLERSQEFSSSVMNIHSQQYTVKFINKTEANIIIYWENHHFWNEEKHEVKPDVTKIFSFYDNIIWSTLYRAKITQLEENEAKFWAFGKGAPRLDNIFTVKSDGIYLGEDKHENWGPIEKEVVNRGFATNYGSCAAQYVPMIEELIKGFQQLKYLNL